MHRNFLKHSIIFLCCFTFIQFINTGCNVCSSKKITCQGYDDSLALQWFPYQLNQQVTFKGGSNKLEVLTINGVDKSEPAEITIGGYGNNRVCNASYRVTSLEMDTPSIPRLQIFSNITYDNSGNLQNKNTQLIFLNETFAATDIVDTGFVRLNTTPSYIFTQFFNTLTLNSKSFINVQILQIDTNIIKPSAIRSVYISKNNGIIGYIRYPSNDLWVKE
jgi:hypothetical protein